MTRESAIAEVSLYGQATSYPQVDTTTLGLIVDKWKKFSTWAPSTTYAVGDRIVPIIPNGRVYEAQQAGTSGTDSTIFPNLYGQWEGRTVSDGTSQPQLMWRDFGPTTQDNYDVKSAIRAVWILKAGMVASEIDAKEGQSDVKLSSLQAQCLMMAERYNHGDILMSPYLKVLLQEAMTRNLVQDMVMVERLTATPDGRGGTTTTWRQVSEFKGRMVNQNNNEMVMTGGMKVVCNWYLVAPANADIQSKDRIRLHDDYAHYYDVVGTDSGQTNLLVMHCALKGALLMSLSAEWVSVVVVILVPMISGIVAQLRLLWTVAEKVDLITTNYRTVLEEIEAIKHRLDELEQELRK